MRMDIIHTHHRTGIVTVGVTCIIGMWFELQSKVYYVADDGDYYFFVCINNHVHVHAHVHVHVLVQ